MKADGIRIGATVMGEPQLIAEVSIKYFDNNTIQITGPGNDPQVYKELLEAALKQVEQASPSQFQSSN